MDKAGNDEFARKVGKIVSQQVKVRSNFFLIDILVKVVQRGAPNQKPNRPSAAAKSLVSVPSSSSISGPVPKETTQQKPKPSNSLTVSRESGIKAPGKLDWSKVKLKDANKGSAITKMPVKTEEIKQEPTVREYQKV